MTNFSIIIPTYNYGHLIGFAIDSILFQLIESPHISVEIIIVDDCSKDNTLEILQKYQHYSFITIITNPDNLGPAKSRNKAIELSQGQYILFLDADDILTQQSLQTIYAFINVHHFPDIIIADHNSISRSDNSDIIIHNTISNASLSSSKHQRFIDYLFKKTISLTAGSVIFRQDILNNFKFCEELKTNEDIPLFAHALVNFNCLHLPFSTVNILKHSHSLRNNHELMSGKLNAKALTDIVFDNKLIPADLMHLKNSYLSLRYLSLFRTYYLAHQYKQARNFYHQAIQTRWLSIFELRYLVKYFKSFI